MGSSPVPAKRAGVDSEAARVLPVEEIFKLLKTTGEGLGTAEVSERLERYGANEITEEKKNPLLKFFSYFWGGIPWMIETAAVLSAVARRWDDFALIVALLAVNAGVGFWEERQAGNAVAALKKNLALKARARRDGIWSTIDSRELVPGDIIRLRAGDVVPADLRLLYEAEVEIDQSALTGESLPVERRAGEALWSGSVVRVGEADGAVYATGKETFFGHTTALVAEKGPVSHFQRAILKIADYLIVMALVFIIVILGTALFRGDSATSVLMFVLVLAVAAIPVALPTVLSVTMAVGARVLAARKAIVTRLAAIEELAGIDILCTDKTGTLTLNTLTLGKPFALKGVSVGELMLSAALASRAEDMDAIDTAVIGWFHGQVREGYTVERFMPYDPVRKRTEASVRAPRGTAFKVTKGATQVVFALCANADDVGHEVRAAVNGYALKGYRAIAVARTDEEGRWMFLGVIPLFDPPRDDSASIIRTALEMGIEVKMVTGDSLSIAREISSDLGLGKEILNASLFNRNAGRDDVAISADVESANGFAEVFPEHKYRIVEMLQNRGHITGMTGDGVNDAPALKKADAGIAVAGSTDAARAAADIVLLSPGLSVIIDAVKESRKIFQRMNNYAIYRIAETVRVLLFMTLSILIFRFYPVTPVMIILLALLNDGAILSIAYDRTHYSSKPESWNLRVVLGISVMLGVLGVVSSFGIFYIMERVLGLDRLTIQSLMYLKLSVAGHLTVFVARTRGPFWSIKPAPVLVAAVVGTQVVATLISVYGLFMAPIGWKLAGFVWGYAFVWFLVNDRAKVLGYRVLDPAGPGLLER